MDSLYRPTQEGERSTSNFDTFQTVSGASDEEVQRLRGVFKDLKNLPPVAYEAGKAIKDRLVDEGFEYDDRYFKLQDVARDKKANCLGLTLLYGAILQDHGVEAKYQMLLNPHDDTFRADQKMFNDLYTGMYFSYDEIPELPTTQADFPTFRFVPLEHPRLVLGGKIFETTILTKDEPEKPIDAEVVKDVTYQQVASNVYVDMVRTALGQDTELSAKAHSRKKGGIQTIDSEKYRKMKDWCEKALTMWPENREALEELRTIDLILGDVEGAQDALERYKAVGSQDSRYLFNLYTSTGDKKYLDAALEKFEHPKPGEPKEMDHILAFFEKHVVLNNNLMDARFNFAVVAWCISNSAALKLFEFYKANRELLVKLYGKEQANKVLNMGK